jgi:hypothetical protein
MPYIYTPDTLIPWNVFAQKKIASNYERARVYRPSIGNGAQFVKRNFSIQIGYYLVFDIPI